MSTISDSEDDAGSSEDDDDDDDESETTATRSTTLQPKRPPALVSSGLSWFREWRAERAEHPTAATRIGGGVDAARYTSTDAIFSLVGDHHLHSAVRFVRLSYLISLARRGGVLPRRQDLTEDAFMTSYMLTSAHADASTHLTNREALLPIISVASCWLTPRHPDPDGVILRAVVTRLERHAAAAHLYHGGGDGSASPRKHEKNSSSSFRELGVYWDWASLMQPDPSTGERRTPPEMRLFEVGRKLSDVFFGHMGVTTILVTGLPLEKIGGRRQRKAKRTFEASGWTAYEAAASRLKVFARKQGRMHPPPWPLVVEVDAAVTAEKGILAASPSASSMSASSPSATATRVPTPRSPSIALSPSPTAVAAATPTATAAAATAPWPMLSPSVYASLLRRKSFEEADDTTVCASMYRSQCLAVARSLSSIAATDGYNLDVESARSLGNMLRECHQVATLQLDHVTGFGDAALAALCAAIATPLDESPDEEGAMAAGAASGATQQQPSPSKRAEGVLAAVLLGGSPTRATANPKSKSKGASKGKAEEKRRPASDNIISTLTVRNNQLTDLACDAIAAAAAVGAFRALSSLSLSRNNIRAKGVKALCAVSRGIGALGCGHGGRHSGGLDGLGSAPFARITCLDLFANRLGNSGCTALANELQIGALPALTELYLGSNAIGGEGASALAAAFESGMESGAAVPTAAPDSGTTGDTTGGDATGGDAAGGDTAEGDTTGSGEGRSLVTVDSGGQRKVLPHLKTLHLFRNRIDRHGALALGTALHGWGLPAIERVELTGNPLVTECARKFVGGAIKRRAWGRFVLRQWCEYARVRRRGRREAVACRKSGLPLPPASAVQESVTTALSHWHFDSHYDEG